MLLPLKLIEKLYKSNVNYSTTFDSCLKNFPSPRIFGQLQGLQSTGELFKESNNLMKRQKKLKTAIGHIYHNFSIEEHATGI